MGNPYDNNEMTVCKAEQNNSGLGPSWWQNSHSDRTPSSEVESTVSSQVSQNKTCPA